MNILMVFHEGPYGSEKPYNGLRWARSLAQRDGVKVRAFMFADAVACAVAGQKVPAGYYNVETMIQALARHGGEVGCCGSCMDARGISYGMLTGGSQRSSLDELTCWTLWADKVISI